MKLAVPVMDDCTEATLNVVFPCTITKFTQLKRDVGIQAEGDQFLLVDIYPESRAMLTVDAALRRGRRGTLRVTVEVKGTGEPVDEGSLGNGTQVDADAFWNALSVIIPDRLEIMSFAGFHYCRGTYQLKGLDITTSPADVPKDKPAVLIDGISLRFVSFANGLERMRIYTSGSLHQEKCLQVDVHHRFESHLDENIIQQVLSLSRVAAGLFVEMKGDPK